MWKAYRSPLRDILTRSKQERLRFHTQGSSGLAAVIDCMFIIRFTVLYPIYIMQATAMQCRTEICSQRRYHLTQNQYTQASIAYTTQYGIIQASSVRNGIDGSAVRVLGRGAALETGGAGDAAQVEGVLVGEHIDPGVGRRVVTITEAKVSRGIKHSRIWDVELVEGKEQHTQGHSSRGRTRW